MKPGILIVATLMSCVVDANALADGARIGLGDVYGQGGGNVSPSPQDRLVPAQLAAQLAAPVATVTIPTGAHRAVASIKGGVCHAASDSMATSFGVDCDYLGRVSIRQIYERGWRVVSGYAGERFVSLVIEEQ